MVHWTHSDSDLVSLWSYLRTAGLPRHRHPSVASAVSTISRCHQGWSGTDSVRFDGFRLSGKCRGVVQGGLGLVAVLHVLGTWVVFGLQALLFDSILSIEYPQL